MANVRSCRSYNVPNTSPLRVVVGRFDSRFVQMFLAYVVRLAEDGLWEVLCCESSGMSISDDPSFYVGPKR